MDTNQIRIDRLIIRIDQRIAELKLTTPSDENANDLLIELEFIDKEHYKDAHYTTLQKLFRLSLVRPFEVDSNFSRGC